MNLKASFFYARKIFFSKSKLNKNVMGRRSLLGAVICIAISLIPLTALLVVSEGMIEGMTERIIRLSTHDIQIETNFSSSCVYSYDEFTAASRKFLSINGVNNVYPEIQSMGLASANAVRTGAFVRAVDENIFSDPYFSSLFEVCEGECSFDEKRSIIISSKMAEILGVKPGDRISLINVKVSEDSRVFPRAFPFKVRAVISSGYQELDELWAFISLKEGFEILTGSACSFLIGLSTDNTFSPLLNKTSEDVFSFIFSSEDFNQFGTSVSTWKKL
ncbi:MAG: ABC transporter permease, partial [Treponema sp.]|nr:ABC transporter permease [Treponema sp.]